MKGHVRKRRSWEYVIDLGMKPVQRSEVCNRRFWVERDRPKLEACPECGGNLVQITHDQGGGHAEET